MCQQGVAKFRALGDGSHDFQGSDLVAAGPIVSSKVSIQVPQHAVIDTDVINQLI
jgi:hypothetical protein